MENRYVAYGLHRAVSRAAGDASTVVALIPLLIARSLGRRRAFRPAVSSATDTIR